MCMMRSFITCVMLLSDKSSGSTALQNELAKHLDVNLVERTIHNENETLYWNKAAAVLGLPQVNILNSDDLPIMQNKARREIIEFLKANLGTFNPPSDDEHLVFEGWYRLCRRYGPVFLEKSPHHLHYWSALQLMGECERRCSDIQFRSLIDNHLRVFKYEELVNGQTPIKCLCAFAGIQWMPGMGSGLRTSSVQKWRSDKMFGFTPLGDVIRFAHKLGYSDAELSSHKRIGWPIYREVTRVA